MSIPAYLLQLRVAKRLRENNTQGDIGDSYYREYKRLLQTPNIDTNSTVAVYNELTVTERFKGTVNCSIFFVNGHAQANPFSSYIKAQYDRLGPILPGLSFTEGLDLQFDWSLTVSDSITFTNTPFITSLTFTGAHPGVQTIPFFPTIVTSFLDLASTYTPTGFYGWLTQEPAFLYRISLNTYDYPNLLSQAGTVTQTAYTDPYSGAPSGTLNQDLTSYPTSLRPYCFQHTQPVDKLMRSQNPTFLTPFLAAWEPGAQVGYPYILPETNYRRWFFLNSLCHFDLTPAQNIVKVVNALCDTNGDGNYGPGTLRRPCFIHHPTAIIVIQAVFTFEHLGTPQNFDTHFEVSIRVRGKTGTYLSSYSGYPFTRSTFTVEENCKSYTIAAPDFYFPLSQISEAAGEYAFLIVEGYADFRSNNIGSTDINCTIYVNTISF